MSIPPQDDASERGGRVCFLRGRDVDRPLHQEEDRIMATKTPSNATAKLVEADSETAKLFNISMTHAVLLRNVNDGVEGAPAIVMTSPEKVLGDQAQKVLAFWLHLDRMTDGQWAAAWDAWVAARATAIAGLSAAWAAARDAGAAAGVGGNVAWPAARDATREAWPAVWNAAWAASGTAASYACAEIQGARALREKGKSFFFLPMFGFADPEAIPALPSDYGRIAS